MNSELALSETTPGFVALVGAGPGHPGLLTLRGQECLQDCEVVLYDGLSNVEMLVHAPQAVHQCVGKHGQSRIWKQDEIIAEMIRHAKAGKRVVRLKGGDPAVFARTSEEVNALKAERVPFEIVPGITAALAAGSYAGIPITHRGIASAVALVTGHEEPGKAKSDLDWPALARFPGTLVIYMGVTTAKQWTDALITSGKDPETPCAILRRCSLQDQQKIQCRLDEVAGHLTPASKFRPPVITIVGEVTGLAESMDWFSRRPLSGKSILVTRPKDQADQLARPLEELGASVVVQPAIEIAAPDDWSDVDAAIEQLESFDSLVFTSRNGVRFFFDRLLEVGRDMRCLGGLKIAVVGDATASVLKSYHLRADWIPETFDADALLEMLQQAQRPLKSTLIVRTQRGRDVIADGLRATGASVREVITYENRDVAEMDPATRARLNEHPLDWITLTSPATARNVHRWLGDSIGETKVAVISPLTAETVRELGWRVDAIAKSATMHSLTQAILDAETT
ncbi:uroporphyrinogen-III C-methyltransferase [Rhodopirellula bahusiensis]|uniref:uroporphyrinogen-III C-methyltransferase n=1 Tax=Rhodopirellula bahusiensis TaxID=2014065 RepID=A0A2G1WA61_9BACT|nr:uroporphyrinogen-III C-methyltransferase [Rhodopirellula bahusiensis]PHQ35913.1 uroporphyrinogen-III C-methyltransferase [Rhodopirellula bahusiensis]